MPRATWRGHLRLSLVTCPVYLTPATSRAKPIRLHQVWQPRPEPRATPRPLAHNDDDHDWADMAEAPDEREPSRHTPAATASAAAPFDEPIEAAPAPTRVALHPHDPQTGEEIERNEVVKGYEYERGRFVTFTPEELKGLDVESSKTIDLERFVPRAELDPVYFDTPYYLYPDGTVAAEAFAVIATAMEEAGSVALARLTLTRRERMVMVEPHDGGLVLVTLRAAEEVRAANFAASREVDPEMVTIAATIIERRAGHFDPSSFRDRYQDALRALIEAKTEGKVLKPAAAAVAPPPANDLMAALKRSLAQEGASAEPVTSAKARAKAKPAGASAAKDKRQRALLLPLAGKGANRKPAAVPQPAQTKRRRNAG